MSKGNLYHLEFCTSIANSFEFKEIIHVCVSLELKTRPSWSKVKCAEYSTPPSFLQTIENRPFA